MGKSFLAAYLNFTRYERTGITVLLSPIVFYNNTFLISFIRSPKPADFPSFKKQIDKPTIKQVESTNKYSAKKFG
jgi:hypothetical protein